MRKTRLIFVIAIVAVIFSVCLTACTKNQNHIENQDFVVSRFGDGIEILESHVAPTTVLEYKDQRRVRAKINVDARLSGYHITGIYLPAGETLTVEVSNTIAQSGFSVLVNNFSSGTRVTRRISSVRTTIRSTDAPLGGIVEILVDRTSEAVSSFNMTIEGGIVIPYYRLGRDDITQIESGGGNYAILDCVNARFYVPTDILYNEDKECVIRDDIYKSLSWWQSAVSFFNKTLEIPSNSNEYTSSVVFGNFGEGLRYDEDRKAVVADKSYFESFLAYDRLIQGEAWDLLYAISAHKVSVSENFSSSVAETMIEDILCSIDNVVMTHFDVAAESDWKWLINPYTCLEHTLQLLDQGRDLYGDKDLMRAFFINIMHSFGLDKTINIIISYGKALSDDSLNAASNDMLALNISEELGADMGMYCEKFGLTLSSDTKKKMAGNLTYIPVQTKFTEGSSESYSMGYTVPMGETATFDFANNIVTFADDEWTIVGVDGDSRLWSEEDGVYYYTPSTDKLTDDFYLNLRNGENSVALYGKINAKISVATYKVYEDWKFDNTSTALDEAMASYQKRTPDYIGSINFAGVAKRTDIEPDPSVYVLTVTEGCITVPKSGKYRIYLSNNGICRVEFGIPKYMNTIFNSTIPVHDFTRYQSYDVVLEENRIYEYRLYLLSTKGECDAKLGIRYVQEEDINDRNDYGIQAEEIDENYLIYKGLKRSDIVGFEPPVIYPMGYGFKDEFYQTHELKTDNFISYPTAVATRDIEYAIDSLSTGSYYSAKNSSNRFVFVIDLKKSLRIEYVLLNVRNETLGKTVEIFVSDDETFATQTQIEISARRDNELRGGDNKLETGDNYFLFNSVTNRYVKIVISDENNFVCDVNDVRIGQYFEESRIVPNTSSMLAYMGGWSNVTEYVSVNGSISESVNNNSIFSFTAKARQICLYGVKDAKYGKMDIYVDGKFHSTIDLYSEATATDQLLFAIDFDTYKEHSIKAMPASKEDVINFDYISYIPVDDEEIQSVTGVLYYALIIPGVIIIVLIGAAIADRREKRRKNGY